MSRIDLGRYHAEKSAIIKEFDEKTAELEHKFAQQQEQMHNIMDRLEKNVSLFNYDVVKFISFIIENKDDFRKEIKEFIDEWQIERAQKSNEMQLSKEEIKNIITQQSLTTKEIEDLYNEYGLKMLNTGQRFHIIIDNSE